MSTYLPFLADSRPCAGCRGPRGPICPVCRPAFEGDAYLVHRDALDLPVIASAAYDGPVREALIAFKDHGRWSLRAPLGASLAYSVNRLLAGRLDQGLGGRAVERRSDPPAPDLSAYRPVLAARRFLLVPVPSTGASLRARDGNHVLELAERVEERLVTWTEALPGLVVVRRRRDQVGLGRSARAANLHGSMRATDVLVRRAARPGTAVVLVDDIVTTGASLAEAHRALTAAGIRPWGAAVVAATPDLPRRARRGRS